MQKIHQRNNLRRTVYCESAKPKVWQKIIIDFGVTSHMVMSEENMIDLHDARPQVTKGYSGTLTRKSCGNWHGYHKRDRKIRCVTLSDTDVIPVLYANVFSVTWSLQEGLQETSEGEALILKKFPQIFALTIKWQTTAEKDLFWAPISTRYQTTPLFWPLRSIIWR